MINKETLKEAIAIIEAEPEICLREWRTETDCGTLFCAAGILASRGFYGLTLRHEGSDYFPAMGKKIGFYALSEIFETSPSIAEHLFYPRLGSELDDEFSDLTDKEVWLLRANTLLKESA